jgi:hypothetical protein
MTAPTKESYLHIGDVVPAVWPSYLPTLPDASFLDGVWAQPLHFDETAANSTARSKLLIETVLALGIPGLDAVSFVLGGYGESTVIPLELQTRPEIALRLRDVPLALRFAKNALKPVRKAVATGTGAVAWEVDPTREHVEIDIGSATVEVNGDGDISVTTDLQLDLPPAMIGDTGIVIEARNIGLFLDGTVPPPGQPAGWRGVHIAQASLYLPGELGEAVGQLQITNAYIGNGGFTGTVGSTWTPPLASTLFGMPFTLQSVAIAFVQNALTSSSIAGSVTLPFFDAPLGVEIAVSLNGAFTVKLSGPGGIAEMTRPGVLSFKVDSLGFGVTDNRFIATMSGTLTPLFGGLDWPGFEVRELSIDSDGAVHLDGGWIDLREQYALDFHGFTLEITRLGLGTNDDGSRWVGFSGGLKLVDGLKAGASVEGLRITWHPSSGDVAISFEGVGVEFEIPGTLRFKGAVSYRTLTVGTETIHRFDGPIKLELIALGLEIDSKIVVGTTSGPDGNYPFLAIYLGLELPAGIPLFSTGLALYGMAGLFAMNMEPDKHADEPWYGVGPEEGWYKRPQIGVSDLAKWTNKKGSFALGAGVTVGTVADNGYTFNGRVLLVISFPGPILMLEGKANILKDRSSLGEDPLFRCLAVLDSRAGNLLVGLDARYKVDSSATLIDIGASAEMFFSYSDPSAWHLYLGMKEPRERRIRAKILRLFESNSYFMLDAKSLAMGAWAGYARDWKFGPLRVGFEAWIEGNAKVNWKPIHFYGDLWARGRAELNVYGFGVGLSVEAKIAADAFDPFHLLGEFSVGIGLPWPLPDFDVSITLEWGPELDWPAAPLPLQEVAIEHLKASTSWPLRRGGNLLQPNYDDGEGFRVDWTSTPVYNPAAAPPADAPVVPLDCRPHVTFARAMHDLALVGTNVSLVDPAEERIGDPSRNLGPVRARYDLLEVALDAWRPATSSWSTVARRAAASLPPNPTGIDPLFGSWAPTPPMPDGGGPNKGQTKLWLWSKNPYDYTRHGGREWSEWISGRFDGDPCIDIPTQTTRCWAFDNVPEGPVTTIGVGSPEVRRWTHPEEPALVFEWRTPASPEVHVIDTEQGKKGRAICLIKGNDNFLRVYVPTERNRGVRIYCRDSVLVEGTATDRHGVSYSATGGTADKPFIEFLTDDVVSVLLTWRRQMCFWRVCVIGGATQAEIDEAQIIAQHNIDEVERWKNIGTVLQPHTNYRLLVRTKITATPDDPALGGVRSPEQAEYAFFRTQGPPALADLSIPVGTAKPAEVALRNARGEFIRIDRTVAAGPVVLDTALNDLTPYVRQTMPPTVPVPGSDRPLPRPVYRGYDVGVDFNENYVSQMYRMEARDLALYLFDSNNQPVRGPDGRLVVVDSEWDRAATPLLDEHDRTWVTIVQHSSCAGIDESTIPRDETLAASGVVLEPDLVHEARVLPLILHETFTSNIYTVGTPASGTGARVGRWIVEDQGAQGAPSLWRIQEVGSPPMRLVEQMSNISSLPDDPGAPSKAGTHLLLADRSDLATDHSDQPSNWTDYRVTLQLRSADDDAIGVLVRRSAPSRWYRFSMDRERRYRRLVRAFDGVVSILAEDDFVYRSNQDYEITIEAVGSRLAIYQDGARIFVVDDPSALLRGTIGLYSWGSVGARFADIRVDDFRATARPAYRFAFTTSRYTNFAHQLHSYQDETWRAQVAGTAIAAAAASAVVAAGAPGAEEARAWNGLEADAAWTGLLRTKPTATEITRVEDGEDTRAFLVRGPEPYDWGRCRLTAWRSPGALPEVGFPGALKLTGVTRHDTDANSETVALMVRDTASLSGHAIEMRQLPGPLVPLAGSESLFDDDFTEVGGVLFTETFGPNALDHYQIVDDGNNQGPSVWRVVGSQIRQTSNIFGSPVNKATLAKPGTMAITGSPDWTDVRVRLDFTSGDDDSIGVVFRYVDHGNYYRLELNKELGYRRLVRVQGGVFTELWSEDRDYTLMRRYRIDIVARGEHLYGFLDAKPLFHVVDAANRRGRVGLYCWANSDSRFDALQVEAIDRDPLLWRPSLADSNGWVAVDGPGATEGPSNWHSDGAGVMVQTSSIRVPDGAGPAKLGTFLLGGDAWEDVHVAARLQSSTPGAIGLLFRVVNERTYYRFSMDRQNAYRRLVKVVDGVVTVLWQDGITYELNQPYDVTVRAVGPEIEVWISGDRMVAIRDTSIQTGRMALYTAANSGARFSDVMVFDATRRIGPWQIVDQGDVNGPSDWRLSAGRLVQRSNIRGGDPAPTSPDKRGTIAVAGDDAWADYRIVVDCSSDDDDTIGIAFRYRDQANYYQFSVNAEQSYRRLVKYVDGTATTLWASAEGYTIGDPIRITIDAVGDRIVGFLGTARLFSVTDGAHRRGRVGLYCSDNDGARFDRIEVRQPSSETSALLVDDFAGPGLGAWTVVDKGTLSAPSAWAVSGGALVQSSNINLPLVNATDLAFEGTYALGGDPAWVDKVLEVDLSSDDDDGIGVMFRYRDDGNYYRFSLDRERGRRRLVSKEGGVFRLLWEDSTVYQTGRRYRLTIVAEGAVLRGFIDGVPVFLVRDGTHARGRIGLYCWGNTGSRFRRVRVLPVASAFSNFVLDENFPLLRSFQWSFLDEGTIGGPSRWSVLSGRLVETVSITGTELVKALGTLAVTGDATWRDYRVTAAMRTVTPGSFGLVFRRADATHYYRFSLNGATGARALVRRTGNQFTTLWSRIDQIVLGRTYLVTVDAVGSAVSIYIDGELMVAIDDDGPASGGIGLYSHANTGAEFIEVRVSEPAWSPYFRFGREGTVAAGTRVRIHSGSAAEPAILDPLEVHRFATEGIDRGERRFTGASVDLRVIGPEGVEHARRFLSESSYTEVPIKVLRKADGTAFLVVPQSADPFTPGTYRFGFEYRRDNTAADLQAPILSERGITSVEQARIDATWWTRG